MTLDISKLEAAINSTNDEETFIHNLLIDALGWPIDTNASTMEEVSYEWSLDEIRAEGINDQIVSGHIKQIQPIDNNPWGIFIVDFANPDIFTANRGLTGVLRKVLRGLVPSKRKASNLPSFQRDNLLFICNHDFKHYRFAYFMQPKEKNNTPPIASFGWGPNDGIRTLCEFNLPLLAWPSEPISEVLWVENWSKAFDVERVTKRFYQDYSIIFSDFYNILKESLNIDDNSVRLETITILNRLMLIRFLEKKGWLKYDENEKYLNTLYWAALNDDKNYYKDILKPLFFKGLSQPDSQLSTVYGETIYLGGGLFDKTEHEDEISFDNSEFESLVGDNGLFYKYNFTVEESTPIDIEVAVDPEMLGKVFEELVISRHQTGSYYTPRNIVSFMSKESLKHYLKHNTDIKNKKIDQLIDSEVPANIKPDEAEAIAHSLRNIKVIDPACGSGAYLLGFISELSKIYSKINENNLLNVPQDYANLKLDIISNNIYGVDKDKFATEIAKLRLWLSMSVDSNEPLPLPNLDFKIETGDSLMGPCDKLVDSIEEYIFRKESKNIAELKSRYVLARDSEKNKIKDEIEKLENSVKESLNRFLTDDSIDWHVNFADVFGSKQGFDIVLANPPYISAIEFKNSYPDRVRQHLNNRYKSAQGAYDIYVLFFERAIELLNNNGYLCFITPNKWLSITYGASLREYIFQNCTLDRVVDLSGIKVFDNVSVYPIITFIKNNEADEYEVNTNLPITRLADDFNLDNYHESTLASNYLKLLPRHIWGFLLSDHIQLLDKCLENTTTLEEAGDVLALTTASEADHYGSNLTENDEGGYFKVINTGTIDPFYSLWGEKNMTHNRAQYLTPYLPSYIPNERRTNMYQCPKVIFAKIAKHCEAFCDLDGHYASLNTNTFYKPKKPFTIEYICGYANSSIFMFIYDQYFGALRMSGGDYQFQAPQLRVMPVKIPTKDNIEQITTLVRHLVDAISDHNTVKVLDYRRKIDKIFLKQFKLTANELSIVKSYRSDIYLSDMNMAAEKKAEYKEKL